MAHETAKSRIQKRPKGIYRMYWGSTYTEGSSQTEVIDKTLTDMEQRIDAIKAPRFLFHNYRGHSAIVGHDGWSAYYTLAYPDGSTSNHWVMGSIEETERAARNHAAQLAWQDGDTASEILLPEQSDDFKRYAKHQQDFLNAKRAVINAGMYEGDAHKYIMDWFIRRHRHDCDTADIARLALEEYTNNKLVLAYPEPDYTPYTYDED